MDRPVELVPLVCLQCGTRIPAEPDEVAWVCGQCGQGMLLDETQGLIELKINYSASVPGGARGKPFWVTEGRITLNRDTFAGNQSRDAQQFWSVPRQFFIPAFACPLETLVQLGTAYLVKPPDCREGPPVPFEPVVLPAEDVRQALEFIVVGIEAGRKDKMREIQFSLDLSPPELWILG